MLPTKDAFCFSHKIYNSDPLAFKNYVGKKVDILTESGNTCSGIVYTMDPVSESVILIELGEQIDLKIVLGHAIKSINIRDTTNYDLPELFTSLPKQVSTSTMAERKMQVKEFLIKNRIPIKEDNDVLLIQDTVAMYPPYEPENCVSSNSIVLGRIQTLLTNIRS